MMRTTTAPLPFDAWTVILLSVRLTYKYLAVWVRMVLWFMLFSIPLVTIPLMAVSMYRLIEMVISSEDPADIRIRDELFRGAFRNPIRDLSLLLLDLFILGVILASLVFWWTRTPFMLRGIAGMSLAFLVLWWVAQVLILPIVAISPSETIGQRLGQLGIMLLVGIRVLMPIAFVCTLTIVISILLLGPLLLVSIPFVAICGSLSYRLSNGQDWQGWKALETSAHRF